MNGITATQAATAPCEATLCWHVSPQTCIAEQQGQVCSAVLNVSWTSKTPQDLCLFLDETQLQCWQAKGEGQWQQHISWPNAILSLRKQDAPVLQTELNVMSRKPMRRRIASPWSIF